MSSFNDGKFADGSEDSDGDGEGDDEDEAEAAWYKDY
jgi:hypothetical protein